MMTPSNPADGEAQRIEDELLRQQVQLESIANNLPGVVYQVKVTPEGGFKVTYVAGKPASVFGMPENTPDVFEWFIQCLSPEDQVRLITLSREAAEKKAPWKFTAFFHKPSGDGVWLQGSSLPYLHGNDLFYNGVFLDVSDHKRAEEELRRSQDRYERLLNTAQEGIWISDPDFKTVFVNGRLASMLGYLPEELIGLPLSALLPKEDWGIFERRKKDARRGEHGIFEGRLLRKDGSVIWALTSASPMMGKKGEFEGGFAMFTDITDRKKAEARQKALQMQLVHAQKMEAVGKLAGGVAHDFNNIITAILVHLNVLKNNKQMPSNLIAGLGELESEAKRCASLTRQLLMFSRRQVMQSQILEVNSLLGNLLRMLRRLIGENISLVFDGTPEDLWVEADPGMLEQVVTNLVVNARDAMPLGGSVRITTSQMDISKREGPRQPNQQAGHFICLEVGDTGSGISPEILKNIFEPFFTTKEEGQGTGLGLATVQAIVTQHKGWVEVESCEGKGSVFRVFLPAKKAPTSSEGQLPAPEPLKRGSETLLLVEDEPAVRKNIALMLRETGYQVLEASNSEEAIRIWGEHQNKIALFLADMVIPGSVSGLNLASQLLTEKSGLKIILMSGYSAEIAQVATIEGLSFLQKPFDPPTLLRVVRERLDSKGYGGEYIATFGNAPER
jgi:PAS domain S-box-containing protein